MCERNFRADDQQFHNTVRDIPGSDDRDENRRSKHIDLHFDEDGNYQTTEATYRAKYGGGADGMLDSSQDSASTSSTPATTETTLPTGEDIMDTQVEDIEDPQN